MLFLCVWAAEASFLVDVENEAAARAAALEEVGEPPAEVRAFPPGTFGARVHLDDSDSDDEGDVIVIEPLDHVADLLVELEDALTPPGEMDPPRCSADADTDSGEVVRCEHAPNHEGPHACGDLIWGKTC